MTIETKKIHNHHWSSRAENLQFANTAHVLLDCWSQWTPRSEALGYGYLSNTATDGRGDLHHQKGAIVFVSGDNVCDADEDMVNKLNKWSETGEIEILEGLINETKTKFQTPNIPHAIVARSWQQWRCLTHLHSQLCAHPLQYAEGPLSGWFQSPH